MRLDSHTCAVALLSLLLCVVLAPSAIAQDQVHQSVRPDNPATPQQQTYVQSLPPQAAMQGDEITVLRDNYAGKYNTASLENLSKLYWRVGAFDIADDLAIGNYIKINECKVFTDFVNDDMEWTKIVDTMRDYLDQNSPSFPLNYQFLIEVRLGRYDPERGGFPLVENTGFTDATRIAVDSIDNRRAICFDENPIPNYPTSILLLLPQPFTLDFVKLDEHVAQAYILRKKALYNQLSEEDRVKSYERNAFLRLRVTFTQYNGNLRGDRNNLMSIMYGNIDGYEIFEDSTQKNLMLSVDSKEQDTSMMSLPMEQPVKQAAQEDKRKSLNLMSLLPSAGTATPVSHSFAQ